MGNLMSCVMICGAVEVVQVVHSDGHVEKLIRPLNSSSYNHKLLKRSRSASSSSRTDLDCFKGKDQAGYLLLPLHNSNGTSSGAEDTQESCRSDSEGGFCKYKRLSSFKFYKSAFCKGTTASNHLTSHFKDSLTLSTSSSSSSSLPSSNTKVQSKSSSPHNHPFRVKQEGGVTKLVVSKKYLAQLLSESNIKRKAANKISKENCQHSKVSSHPPPQSPSPSSASSASASGAACPGRNSVSSRQSVWRPALESISEAQNHASR